MNYFEHHIGDYDQATAHLSAVEDGIYSRLIRRYMATEKPLPADVPALQRLVRAHTREEKRAVQTILQEFFELRDDGYHQHRCDEEIARFQEKSAKAKRSAEARWSAQRPESEGIANAHANASAEHDASAMRTHSEGNAPRARPQTPDTKHQTPEEDISAFGLVGEPDPKPGLPNCPHQAIVEHYHEVLPELPRVKLMSEARKKALSAFWRWVLTSKKSDGTPRASTADQALTWIRQYFERARLNDFLMGRTQRGSEHANWRCDLDFLLTERGKKHVIEKTVEVAA